MCRPPQLSSAPSRHQLGSYWEGSYWKSMGNLWKWHQRACALCSVLASSISTELLVKGSELKPRGLDLCFKAGKIPVPRLGEGGSQTVSPPVSGRVGLAAWISPCQWKTSQDTSPCRGGFIPLTWDPVLKPQQSLRSQFLNRDFRLQSNTPASSTDDCYFGSTGGVNIFLFRLHFLVQLSTM